MTGKTSIGRDQTQNNWANFSSGWSFVRSTKKYLDEEIKRWVDRDVSEKDKNQGDLFVPNDDEEKEESTISTFDEEVVTYDLVDKPKHVSSLVEKLLEHDTLCFDTETSGTDPMKDTLVGISLSAVAGVAYYIPVNGEEGIEQEQAIKLVQPLFSNPGSLKIAHNYKFDYMILNRAGLEIEGPAFDTMIAAYLIDANQKLKMDALSEKYLNYQPIPIEELIGKGRKQKSLDQIPPEEVRVYACEDADITHRLYEILEKVLDKDELKYIAETLEFPLMEVLARMEMEGIRLDVDLLKEFSETLRQDLQELEQKIYDKAGTEFNINSPQQLGEVLFDKMGLPAGKKTKTGQYSTSESVLSKLEGKYEMPGLILEYRLYSKLRSTLCGGAPEVGKRRRRPYSH
ncbi:MAG: DNA polymerase [Balneolaceae bacterium]|nr:DNA polymerase [Balneolaceae bacterium]